VIVASPSGRVLSPPLLYTLTRACKRVLNVEEEAGMSEEMSGCDDEQLEEKERDFFFFRTLVKYL